MNLNTLRTEISVMSVSAANMFRNYVFESSPTQPCMSHHSPLFVVDTMLYFVFTAEQSQLIELRFYIPLDTK